MKLEPEEAESIVALVEHKGWLLVSRHLSERASAIEKQIVDGGCEDYDTYRRYTGLVQGLKAAAELVEVARRQVREALGGPD